MENMTPARFFDLIHYQPDLPPDQREAYRTLQAALTYIPVMLVFNALGFVVLYSLGLAGLLDQNDSRLLIVTFTSLLSSSLHLPLFPLMRSGKFNTVAVYLLLINGLASAAQVLVWQDIVWFPLALAVSPGIVFATQRGLQRNFRIFSGIFSLVLAAIVFFADQLIPFKRMVIAGSLTQVTALTIYMMIITAMVVLVLINSRINFRTISTRLVTTFTFVALLSSVAILIIAALTSIYFDNQKALRELDATSSFRTTQVEAALANLDRDANLTLGDAVIEQQILYLLFNKPDSPLYQEYYDFVRANLLKEQAQNSKYQEILLLDGAGKAIISTNQANEGLNFSNFNFFQNVTHDINHAVEYNFPAGFDEASILLAKPIKTDGILRGALVARTNFDPIKQILMAKTAIGNTAETYLVGLVGGNMKPITITRQNPVTFKTRPAEQALLLRSDQGSGIWDNYMGRPVLGSYLRMPALKAVLIAEVEQKEITQKAINILATEAAIGAFTLLFTFFIVLITSRSISLPLVELAEKATNLANGELSTRIRVERQDEIGALAASFNTLAGEMQSLVKTLEQKVEDRTQALRKQATYLTVAAEVARVATNTQSLEDLLNQAAQLVLDKFGFYHIGIFLLDEQKEYAILRASPTEAGLEMLARRHKLRIGQVGIVGNVAATGLSRIALDTNQDTTYFDNPLLPHTRSEVALPLKTGNTLIGVLDVQSDKPEAFYHDDIAVLQIVADQLALAIQRVQLAQEQEDNLRQLESAYQHLTLTNWQTFSQDVETQKGYKFDGIRVTPIENIPAENREAINKGLSVVLPGRSGKEPGGAILAVPLKLRDQLIGVLSIQFNSETIPPDTISLVEETAARLSTALENARLYTQTQKMAQRERAISEISNRITTSVNLDNILRTTVQEIGRMLPDAEVTVQIKQNEK